MRADEYAKEDARDFVLWKAAKAEDETVGAAWDAPFGRGRPGWHIECSAMALELIGTRLAVTYWTSTPAGWIYLSPS